MTVEVSPSGAGRPSTAGNPRLGGDVGKRAIAVVVVKLVATVCGDVQIFPAVAVVVAHRHTHTVACTLKSGVFRNILKRAILFLMLDTVPFALFWLFLS